MKRIGPLVWLGAILVAALGQSAVADARCPRVRRASVWK
jgi:hypothetical protein